MASNKQFCTPQQIELLLFQNVESDDELEDGSGLYEEIASESDDEVLVNSDNEDDTVGYELPYQTEPEEEPSNDESMLDDRQFELGKDNETIWTTKPLHSKFSKTPKSNLISHLPGPKGGARGVTNEVKLFSLFITDEMIDKIVLHTNTEIEVSKIKYSDNLCSFIKPTDNCEIKAFIGLLYMSGVLKKSGLRLEDMFSEAYGPPIFRCTMSQKRFSFLLLNLRFDDKGTRVQRKSKDKFAAFREIWDAFVIHCKENYTPSEYLTVDETLLGFRGRCAFKMYIPSKPDKYGLKIISLCDARTFYFISGIPYVGKENVKKRGDLSFPTQYVLRLTEPYKNSNRNVTTDNWFTSYELSEELSNNNLTLVGTLRKNKKETPPSMLLPTAVGQSKFLYQDNKMMVSYTPKRNKKVLLMSSMHREGTVNEKTAKPEIIEFYNLTKGGVDVLDKLCHDKTTKRKTRRWPLRFFFGVLDMAAVNSYILFKWNTGLDNFSSQARNIFLKNLALALTAPMMATRLQNPHISRNLRHTVAKVLGKEDELRVRTQATPNVGKKRKRCNLCDPKLDRKGNEVCVKCSSCVCGEHKQVLCTKCIIDEESGEDSM